MIIHQNNIYFQVQIIVWLMLFIFLINSLGRNIFSGRIFINTRKSPMSKMTFWWGDISSIHGWDLSFWSMDDTNNGKKCLSFQMQIGLTRDQINVEGELTLASLKEIACSFVDRKVSTWRGTVLIVLFFSDCHQVFICFYHQFCTTVLIPTQFDLFVCKQHFDWHLLI